MDTRNFQYLQFNPGEVSVESYVGKRLAETSTFLLIVGPTGAGKSSFIESFAGKSQNLSISKDQLEGYTQVVTPYRLMNIHHHHEDPVFLVDTPGFSDSKISELEVLEMIRAWLSSNRKLYVHHVYFLIPINTPRLAGSRRQTIDMIKTLLKGNWNQITFLTTMWDALHNERLRERGESHFAQLRDEILKDFIADGATITRFTNTKEASLRVLDVNVGFTREFTSHASGTSAHGAALYQDLLVRIKSGLQKQKDIEDDLATLDTRSLPELHAIQTRNHKENRAMLWKFVGQYLSFTNPPAAFEHATFDLDKAIIADPTFLHPHSPYRNLLYNYDTVDRNAGSRDWLKLRLRIWYAILCDGVNRALHEKAHIDADLAPLHNATNIEAKSILEQKQTVNQEVLWEAIAQWIRCRIIVDGFEDVRQALRKAVMEDSDIVCLDSSYDDLFFFWKHHPDPQIDYWLRPDESGVFDDETRDMLKEQRMKWARE